MIGNYTGLRPFSGQKAYARRVKPRPRFLFLALILALGALAPAVSSPPKKGSPPPNPREKDLIAALPDDDRRWLVEFVAPIILPEEKKAYLELTETYQRDDFREKFWERRELPQLPLILRPGYRYRYPGLRELAGTKYDGGGAGAGGAVIPVRGAARDVG